MKPSPRLLAGIALGTLLTACSETSYYASPGVPAPPSRQPATVAISDREKAEPEIEPAHATAVLTPLSAAAAAITVLEGKTSPKRGVVVGIIDVHTDATRSEEAFDELRRRAAALGADVVIAADFHHGEGSEPSHVSGMAIRFREHSDLPYDKLGEIDVVASSGDSAAQATALDRLKERATKMGVDEVINVEFHHGEEKGEASHLTGLAIRHHRAKTW
jgi:uncharacterized protein YbjQ (UPF0145 family)